MPLKPAKYAALAAEGRLPEAAQVAIKNLIRVSLTNRRKGKSYSQMF